jgi:hypothetical protein
MPTPNNEVTQENIASYVKYLVTQARVNVKKSIFDRPVIILHYILNIPFMPLVLLQFFSTAALGCLPSILLLPFHIIWWLFLGIILALSWLWNFTFIFRPILLLPEVFIAELASAYIALMPSMGEWQARGIKLAICESWPHSISIFRGRVK